MSIVGDKVFRDEIGDKQYEKLPENQTCSIVNSKTKVLLDMLINREICF